MITFQDTYDSRKNEIENFLELMKFLEQKENEREDGKSKFSEFFYPENGGIHLTYQALINILLKNIQILIIILYGLVYKLLLKKLLLKNGTLISLINLGKNLKKSLMMF